MLVIVCYSNSFAINGLNQQRKDFVSAERLLEQGNESEFLKLTEPLIDYPLYPYLQYLWLKDNLQQTDKIQGFLLAYKDSRFAELLRAKWLPYLAKNERWLDYINNYQATDSIALECQYYWANYKTGNEELALTEAKRLWLVGHEQPKECEKLFSTFTHTPLLTTDLVWKRFGLALKENNTGLAGAVRQLLSEPDQPIADRWLQVHKDPLIIQGNEFLSGNDLQGHIFAHGVDRLVKSDLNTALLIWDSKKSAFAIDIETVQKLERKLALALAYERDERAYERLKPLITIDADVREWSLRAALLEQNWQHVAEALAGSPPEEQKTPQWRYWQARSLMATGNIVLGQVVYNQLAEDRSYYGFMAADQVNKSYAFSNNPVNMTGNELESLAETPDFKIVQEFKLLGRETEAKRHWVFTVKKLSQDQLKIAAKLAEQWQWYQLAIITLVKADYWDDLEIRFPLKYLSQVQANAEWQALNPALIFGLMRQESMLDEHAKSAVGALGLMQIMPETGKQIARNLNESWQSDNALLKPDVNIKYGTFYYRQLLSQFDGHFGLATAAYNAGSGKVIKWLPSQGLLPADVWIETIPYKETRKYVMSVLSYATIYQQRMQKEALKITGLLFDVHSR